MSRSLPRAFSKGSGDRVEGRDFYWKGRPKRGGPVGGKRGGRKSRLKGEVVIGSRDRRKTKGLKSKSMRGRWFVSLEIRLRWLRVDSP